MKIVESAQKCNPKQIARNMNSIVDQAYDQAMKNLGKIFGSDFSVDTAERVNGNMGRSAGEFLDDLPMPEAGSEAKLLVATADCKGVPLVKDDSEKVAAFETAKKNPGNRRMATVTSVQRGITAAPLASDRWIVRGNSLGDILSNRSRGVLPRKFCAFWPKPEWSLV